MKSPFASIALRLSKERRLNTILHSLAIMKRGVCTFPSKASGLISGGATVGVMVNSPDGNLDIPSGKEDTSQMTTPLGIMKETDGNLIQVDGPVSYTHLTLPTKRIV